MSKGIAKAVAQGSRAARERQNFSRILKNQEARVVGIVDSRGALEAARTRADGVVDFLEWRADCLGTGIVECGLPWIVTARHPSEGGQNAMDAAARRAALMELLPAAAVVDVEIRSLRGMADVVREAKAGGVAVLASFHDFRATPNVERLLELARRAREAGADAVKVAARTERARDVARLLEFLDRAPLPAAVMGMGPLGMASRVALAAAGSVLNYGWLHRPNVSGQWSAAELRGVLEACRSKDRR